MKKTLSIALLTLAALMFAGCSSEPEATTSATTTAEVTTTSITTTAAPTTTEITTTTAVTTTTAPDVSTPSQEEIDAALSEAAEIEQKILEQAASTTSVTTATTTEATTAATTTSAAITTTKAATTTASKQSYTDIYGNTYTVEYGKELSDVPKPNDATNVEKIDDLGGKYYTKYVGSDRYIWDYINGFGWVWTQYNGTGGVVDNSDWVDHHNIPGYLTYMEPDGSLNPDKLISPDGEVISNEEYKKRAKEYWGDLYEEE